MYYTTQGLCCYIHNYKTSTGHRTSWKHSWTSLRRTDQPMLEPKRGLHASPKRQHWATSRQFSDVSCLVFNYFGCFKKKLVRGKWNRFANFCIPKNFGAHAYARRTAPNKQASTFIFLYKLLFFFLPKHTWRAPIRGSAQSSLQLHVAENKYHRSTDRNPLSPGQFCCTYRCWWLPLRKNHDGTFNSLSWTSASAAKSTCAPVVAERIDTKSGTRDSMHIM